MGKCATYRRKYRQSEIVGNVSDCTILTRNVVRNVTDKAVGGATRLLAVSVQISMSLQHTYNKSKLPWR